MMLALAIVAGLTILSTASVGGSMWLAKFCLVRQSEEDLCETVIGHDRCELEYDHDGPHKARGQWWTEEQLGTGTGQVENLRQRLLESEKERQNLIMERASRRIMPGYANDQERRVREAFAAQNAVLSENAAHLLQGKS